MSKKSTEIGVGKKVLASALSAAMVVAFAPAVAMADGTESGDTQATASQPSNDGQTTANEAAKSLPAAVNDTITISESGTYQLAADVTGSIVVESGVDATLDLNGKTLMNVTGSDTIYVKQGASLRVTGSGIVDNVSHAKAAVFNNGTVSLDGGKYTRSKENGKSTEDAGGNSYYNILNHGVMTINNGVEVIQDGNFSSLIDNGYYKYDSTNERSGYVNGTNAEQPRLTINGGTFSGGINTIKNDDNGQMVINEGSFTNYTQAALQNHGTAEILGGTFTAESQFSIDNCGCNATHDPGKLTISGGAYTGTFKVRSQFSDVTVSGGTFNGAIALSAGKLTISGGTFTDIANAVKYAANTATLTMGADATASLTIPVGKDITLDLNGHNVAPTTGDAFVNKGTLTISGSGTVKAEQSDHAAVANFPDAKAYLKGGTYKSQNWYVLKNMGEMEIDGAVSVGTDNSTSPASLIDNGWVSSTDTVAGEKVAAAAGKAQLTIKSGDFKGSSGEKSCSVVKNDDYGVLKITGGTFDSTANAGQNNATTILNWNVATISGGTFKGQYLVSNGSYTGEADKGQIAITGGTFTGSRSLFGYGVGGNNNANASMVISGGMFSAPSFGDVPYKPSISAGTFSVDPAAYLADGSVVYKKHSGSDYSYIAQASGAAQPANSSGYNYWTSSDGKTYTEGYSAPVTPVDPTPTPTPTPEPAAPGTNVSGTDSAGNTVEATVTDNNKTTLPDGTEAAGSVEFKGTTSGSGSEPASSADIPASVTSSDGTVYAVTKIADDAFNGQGQLKSVSIPATVVEIGARAFANTSISSVVIPAATTTIGAGVFQGCDDLESVDISKAALTSIPEDAFNGAAISSIDIPGTVRSVGARAFKGTALRSVELPKAVSSIAKSTFQDCDALKSASSSAKTIGRSAFAGCSSLKTVSLPKATEVGAYALSGTALKSVSLPKAQSIGAGAFKDAAKLKALATGSVLEELGPKALDGTKIKILTIRSKRLTKSGVKGSLKGSAVTKVEVAVTGSKKTQDKYVKRYSKFFAKANSGKSVEVTKAKKASKK